MAIKLFIWLICICFVLSGCGTAIPIDAPQVAEDTLPKVIPLEFKPVEVNELVEQGSDSTWKQVKSVPFGTFNGSPVILHLYKEPEQSNLRDVLRGVFEIQGKHYRVPYEVSDTLLQEQSEHNNWSNYYLIQRNFPTHDGPLYIAGGINLFANGPWLVMYLIYDRTEAKWKVFDEWGIPYVHDLNSDGKEELIVQFPGMHLQPSSVVLFSMSTGKRLESARVVTNELAQGRRVLATINQDTSPWLIHVVFEEGPTYRYRYESSKLIRTP